MPNSGCAICLHNDDSPSRHYRQVFHAVHDRDAERAVAAQKYRHLKLFTWEIPLAAEFGLFGRHLSEATWRLGTNSKASLQSAFVSPEMVVSVWSSARCFI